MSDPPISHTRTTAAYGTNTRTSHPCKGAHPNPPTLEAAVPSPNTFAVEVGPPNGLLNEGAEPKLDGPPKAGEPPKEGGLPNTGALPKPPEKHTRRLTELNISTQQKKNDREPLRRSVSAL